jgi:hypothetical protein
MNYRFVINAIKVFPEWNGLREVVGYVRWTAIFELDGFENTSCGETFLNPPSPDTFIDVSTLSKEAILDWVISKEGGGAFVQMLSEINLGQLQAKINQTLLAPSAILSAFEEPEYVPVEVRAPVNASPIFPTPYSGTISASYIG